MVELKVLHLCILSNALKAACIVVAMMFVAMLLREKSGATIYASFLMGAVVTCE